MTTEIATVIQFPTTLDAKAERIRALAKQTVENVIEIGKLLTECKTEVGHGRFGAWLDREFGWGEHTARRFMNVTRMYNANRARVLDLDVPMKSLYLLAAPENADICNEVIEEVVQEAKVTNTRPDHKSVKRKVKAARARKPKRAKPSSAKQSRLPKAKTTKPAKQSKSAKSKSLLCERAKEIQSRERIAGIDIKVSEESWALFGAAARSEGHNPTTKVADMIELEIGGGVNSVRRTAAEATPLKMDVGTPRYLTPEEVDPEFTGTPMEFTAKYGHVQTKTAEQFATMRFTDWSQFITSLAKKARAMPELRNVDRNWLRKPEPNAAVRLAEALNVLRPFISEAEALLVRANEALKINESGEESK